MALCVAEALHIVANQKEKQNEYWNKGLGIISKVSPVICSASYALPPKTS